MSACKDAGSVSKTTSYIAIASLHYHLIAQVLPVSLAGGIPKNIIMQIYEVYKMCMHNKGIS